MTGRRLNHLLCCGSAVAMFTLACIPSGTGLSVDAGQVPVDSGQIDPDSDSGAPTSPGVDAGVAACFPNRIQWSGGDANCRQARIVFADPESLSSYTPTMAAVDVNDRGTVLFFGEGWDEPNQKPHPIVSLWRDGTLTRLRELEFDDLLVPLKLGPNDEVGGRIEGEERRAFLRWPDGGVQIFEDLLPDGYHLPIEVVDINRHGQVLLRWAGGIKIWSSSEVIDVPLPPGASDKGFDAFGINDYSVVVGRFGGADGGVGALVWSPDAGFIDAAGDCVGEGSSTWGISNRGTVGYFCSCEGLNNEPLLYRISDGQLFNLGGVWFRSVFPYDINSLDWVVATETPVGRTRGVLMRNGGRCVLEKMLPADAGWFIDSAYALNNTGLVLVGARRWDAGAPYAFPAIMQLDVGDDAGVGQP